MAAQCTGQVTVQYSGEHDGIWIRCGDRYNHADPPGEGWFWGEWVGFFPTPEECMEAKQRHDDGFPPQKRGPAYDGNFNDGYAG